MHWRQPNARAGHRCHGSGCRGRSATHGDTHSHAGHRGNGPGPDGGRPRRGPDTNASTYTDPCSNAYGNTNTHAHAHADSASHSYPNSCTYTDPYAHTDSDTSANPYADPYTHADSGLRRVVERDGWRSQARGGED